MFAFYGGQNLLSILPNNYYGGMKLLELMKILKLCSSKQL